VGEHTPTTEVIRERATKHAARFGFLQELSFEDQFDRWLEAHDREIAAEAWDEGFTRGFYSGQSMRSDADASESPVENPYRADRLRENGGA